MKSLVARHQSTVTTSTYEITADDIRRAFGLAKNARVFIQIPGGGDWSGMALDIDDQHPVMAVSKSSVEEDLL